MTRDRTRALADALAWQVELGADEAIGEAPLDRFAPAPEANPAPEAPPNGAGLPPPARVPTPAAPREPARATHATAGARPSPVPPGAPDPHACETLPELARMLEAWDGTPLKETARNFVFCDGLPGAHLMVIGEAPGQDEDRLGKPFVGRAGQLLDRMLAAIGRARTETDPARAAYITNILPWRPPGNRTPSEAEAAVFLPFVERHIALAAPRVILSMGNTPTKALLSTTTGIKRMRGGWVRHEASGLPLLPSFHPAYLLRQPADKRLAWADLLAVRAALDGAPPAM